MYPGNYNIEWHGFKGGEPVEDAPKVGSVARAWQWREMGINPQNQPPNKTVLENIAEDILVQKPLQITSCDLPGYPRSTFLMVFSPDGTKLASTHGNHNIYVSELASGKHVRILKGHPRTPWCIAFHPSHPQLIGSGCLGGQVRVWDIASGGSEVWNVFNETVIASIAFHPREQLLVIATYNELYFWDWSQPAPFTKVSTKNINEKVRYVAFDSLGFKLITGISLWAYSGNANGSPVASQNGPPNASDGHGGDGGNFPDDDNSPGDPRDPREDPPRDFDGRPIDTPAAAQDMIVSSYQTLVQRYDSLVRNYQRLFMVRHRLIDTPLANTIDRGTDPMESYPPERHRRRMARRTPRSAPNDTAPSTPGTSRQHQAVNHVIGTPPAPPDPNVVNLEEFSYDPVAVRTDTSAANLQPPVFRSLTSAFQPLSEERANSRMLPNPFSSTSPTPRQPYSSRTSGIFRGGAESALSALRLFSIRRRNLDAVETAARNAANSSSTDQPIPFASAGPYIPPPLPSEPPPSRPPPPSEPAPIPSTSGRRTTNQLDTEAHTINESLDLIRDILRDSGTRLLNLITNMSINILTNSERDENARVPVHVFTGNLRRDFMASSSDSESEHTEVNITRTPNTTFREETVASEATDPTPERPQNVPQVSDRMTFELDSLEANPFLDRINMTYDGQINVLMANDRFRVRTQGSWAAPSTASSSSAPFTTPVPSSAPVSSTTPVPSTTAIPPTPISLTASIPLTTTTAAMASESSTTPTPSILSPVPSTSAATEPRPGPSSAPDNFDPNVPSTSREGFLPGLRAPEISAAEAFRRVQLGVTALQKHTLQLANMWLRGDRTTMRELRTMWEDLRRRVIALHKEAGCRSDTPSFYTRSLLERCMILTELTEVSDLSGRRRRNANRGGDTQNTTRSEGTQNSSNSENQTTARNEESQSPSGVRNGAGNPVLRCFQLATAGEPTSENAEQSHTAINTEERQTTATIATGSQSSQGQNTRNSEGRQTATNAGSRSTSRNVTSNSGSSPSASTSQPSTSAGNAGDRSSAAARVRRVLNNRYVRLQQACRWRSEDEGQRRARNSPRLRISHLRTRHRSSLMRTVEQSAMRHVIRTRAMKVLSAMFNMMMICIEEPGLSQVIINMLKTLKKALALTCFIMMSNRNAPRSGANPPASQSVATADVVRIQNVEHSGPVNVDDEDPQSRTIDPVNETNEPKPAEKQPSTSSTHTTPVEELPSPLPNSTSQTWSQRLAVQIAAANRNHSSTANSRRDLYLETRREKALHRTNPNAHPYIRKRLPPVSSHRIPALRTLPPGRYQRISPRNPPEPVAGPSNAPDPNDPPNMPGDERDHFIRLAHIRLRTAARNRFRRLQTIRLYTPSTVREMFALQDFQQDRNRDRENREGREEENDGPGVGQAQREQFAAMLAREGVGVLQMQVNEPPAAEHGPQRLPRIHEYLQPIILAQNAMVVDEEEAHPPAPAPPGHRRFGMAGLLDAGIISEALPAPSHRVQAWDFTSGAAPQIANNTKNVVVQRCRIHNDASIDISKDGRLLVALLPVTRLRNTNNWLGEYPVGVYSLEWPRLGQCLHTAVLEQSAVSVALSPTARYLAVGLGSRRFTSSHSRTNIIALLYKLDPLESSSRTGLSPMKELEQYWEHGFTSLNCLRWAPQPGQGLVYANNTGQLIIMS